MCRVVQLVVKLQEEVTQRGQSMLKMSKQVCELEEEVRGERLQRSRLRREAQQQEELISELQLNINATHVSQEQLQSKVHLFTPVHLYIPCSPARELAVTSDWEARAP